ncbi:MAG: hypothetical protein ACP5ID_02965 [Conexivisphaera sp.]
MSADDVAAWMPARDRGRRRVLIVGGSWRAHGDPALAGLAALSAGAEEVYVAVPSKLADSVRCLSPDLRVLPLPDQKLTRGAAAWIADHLRSIDAAYIGANFVDGGGAADLELELAASGARLVLGSAGARRELLARLAKSGARFAALYGEEELAEALGGMPGGEEELAEALRRASVGAGGAVAILGPRSLASDGNLVFLCSAGIGPRPAGIESIVGGLAAGLAALGMDELRAAAAALFITGLAGDAASSRKGLHWGASALIEELPGVLLRFDRVRP